MKAIKLVLIMLVVFSVKVFSQNPIIENVNICTSLGSTANISVTNPLITASYAWEIKTPSANWVPINNANAGSVYTNFNTPVLTITRSSLPVALTRYRVVATSNSINLTSNESI